MRPKATATIASASRTKAAATASGTAPAAAGRAGGSGTRRTPYSATAEDRRACSSGRVRPRSRRGAVERRQAGERVGRPGRPAAPSTPRAAAPAVPHDRGRALGRQVERRGSGEHATRAGARPASRRRSPRSTPPAARPGVASACRPRKPALAMNASETRKSRASPRRRAASPGDAAEHEADERRDEDEPEVGRVVLPVGVRLRTGEQEREPGQRECQWKEPAGHGRRSP